MNLSGRGRAHSFEWATPAPSRERTPLPGVCWQSNEVRCPCRAEVYVASACAAAARTCIPLSPPKRASRRSHFHGSDRRIRRRQPRPSTADRSTVLDANESRARSDGRLAARIGAHERRRSEAGARGAERAAERVPETRTHARPSPCAAAGRRSNGSVLPRPRRGQLLDLYYNDSSRSLVERALATPSAIDGRPIIGAVADWVWAVLAFETTAFRAQKQHLDVLGS